MPTRTVRAQCTAHARPSAYTMACRMSLTWVCAAHANVPGNAGNGTINYSEFANVLFKQSSLPAPIAIPDELKPYVEQLKSKEAGKGKD